MSTPTPDAPLSPVEAARAKLQAVIGGDDPQARLALISQSLVTCRSWSETDLRDRYDQDVAFLLTLEEFHAARIAELEMVSDASGAYLHAAREHIAALEAKIERVTPLAAIRAEKGGA